jgi:hypothetical protein
MVCVSEGSNSDMFILFHTPDFLCSSTTEVIYAGKNKILNCIIINYNLL